MDGTADNVKLVLEEEYKLLCQGHAFKLAFDEHAKDQRILAIPSEFISTRNPVQFTKTIARILLQLSLVYLG